MFLVFIELEDVLITDKVLQLIMKKTLIVSLIFLSSIKIYSQTKIDNIIPTNFPGKLCLHLTF